MLSELQTVQALIRLLLREQSDQSLHLLPLNLCASFIMITVNEQELEIKTDFLLLLIYQADFCISIGSTTKTSSCSSAS